MGKLYPYLGQAPRVEDDVFIAPGAVVCGDVTVEKGVGIWYNAVAGR